MKQLNEEIDGNFQELVEYGGLQLSMKLVGGKTVPPWRTWILLSEPGSRVGSLSTWGIYRYVISSLKKHY